MRSVAVRRCGADYDDIAEAAEAVTTASLLMRILDRVEHRLS